MTAPARAAAAFAVVAVTAAAQPNASLIVQPSTPPRAAHALAPAFAAARASVVHVAVEVTGEHNTFRIERGSSGAVVGADLVVTLWSLVREADGAGDKRVLVQPATGTALPATIAARDVGRDLALLRVEVPADRALPPALPLAAGLHAGDPVAVLGFPDGEDRVAFAGVLTPAQGDVAVESGALARTDVWLTDAAVERRCHGAAVLGCGGELVGLCSAERVREIGSEPTLEQLKQAGFGFVLPAPAIRAAFADALPPPAPAAQPSPAAAVVAGACDSVVAVLAGSGDRPPLGDDPPARRRRDGVGSGVIVSARGLVLTDRHLVHGRGDVRVTLAGGEVRRAEVVGDDAASNTALLRVAVEADEQLPALALGHPGAVGAAVVAVGNPEGVAPAVSAGVLSAVRGSHVQTDAAVGNDNGGGALLSLDGLLIGVLDSGRRDAVDIAFAHRGDRAKLETGLNLVPTAEHLAGVYAAEFARDGVVVQPPRPTPPSPVADLVARVGDAMLNVYVEITTAAAELEDNPFATPKGRTVVEGLGSGVIVDPSGLALTNWHVVDSATEPDGSMRPDRVVRVSVRGGEVFPATVLSISREEDLALLQLELAPGARVPFVELGSSEALAVGDGAVAIGNPHGRANTVTAGVVTAKNQAIRVRGRWAKLPHLLETDAAINGGNSGGALLDLDGRLIGINSAGGSLVATTGYAIGVDHVRRKLHAVLLTPHKLRSAYAGVSAADRDGRVLVVAVDPFGPAAQAGVEKGDLLLALGGEPVAWTVGWATSLLRAGAGRDLPLAVERDGARRALSLRPWSAATWAVLRQTDLLLDELSVRDDAERVRAAALAFYRAFTGDPTAAPAVLPGTLPRVVRLHPNLEGRGVDVQPGDLLLGVQVTEAHAAGEAAQVERCERVADVQRSVQEHSAYDGAALQVWLCRGGEVRRVALPTRKLML